MTGRADRMQKLLDMLRDSEAARLAEIAARQADLHRDLDRLKVQARAQQISPSSVQTDVSSHLHAGEAWARWLGREEAALRASIAIQEAELETQRNRAATAFGRAQAFERVREQYRRRRTGVNHKAD